MGLPEKNGVPPGYKSGKLRSFFSTQPPQELKLQSSITKVDRFYIFVITALALSARFYKLPEPPKVVFDEVHVGGYVKKYFDGEFFVDVHPPLAKLIYYGVSKLQRWDGQFEFHSIGDVFDDSVPFIAMRSVSALCGALTVVLTYLILRGSACRPIVALFGAFLLLVENSLATQSRFILLDAPLVFFTALTVYSFKKFELATPFSKLWYRNLLGMGIALGWTVSTKLTGLFTFAWVGVWMLYQIWLLFGDLDVSYKRLFGHIIARAVALIFVPLTIYCGIFSLHFMLLPYNGTGTGSVSPQFQAGFADSDKLRNTAVDVSYGSTITIRHHRLDMYLHSHKYKYKTGTHQQQVTMYGFAGDWNSQWVIETAGTNFAGKFDSKFRPIKNGDTVKLYHKPTDKYLRASDVRPPNSEHDYSNEVSCDGNRTNTEDINFEWKVKIVGKKPHLENEIPLRKLRATETVFQLVHKGTNCILMGQNVQLPAWAFNQNQVLCVNDPTISNTLWYIEKNNHPVIDADIETYPRVKLPQLLLFRKLVDYHHSMWRINNGFTEEHSFASSPFAWPFVVRGINYFSNGHGSEKLTDEVGSHIYFLGNVAVYLVGVLVVLVFGVKFAFYLFSHLNPFQIPVELAETTRFYIATSQFVSAWAINFFPYLQMLRQLFAHHYLPCVLFLVLATAQFMDHQARVRPVTAYVAMAAISAASLFCFVKFSPLIYGLRWSVLQCQVAKWFPSWDFDCMAYSY